MEGREMQFANCSAVVVLICVSRREAKGIVLRLLILWKANTEMCKNVEMLKEDIRYLGM